MPIRLLPLSSPGDDLQRSLEPDSRDSFKILRIAMDKPTPAPTSPAALPRRILLTGAAGAVGRRISLGLVARGHWVRGFDLHPSPGVSETVVGDLADAQAVSAAVEGCDIIIHLGAYPNDADFIDVLLKPNVIGLYHVLDSARQHNVRRLVLASTMQVISGLKKGRSETVRLDDGVAPVNHYALTKVWAEAAGEMYARKFGLSVINVRIGWFVRNQHEAQRVNKGSMGDWTLSHDDAVRFFCRCVESEAPAAGQCVTLFAISGPPGESPVDMTPARESIGFEPQDRWPAGTYLDQ